MSEPRMIVAWDGDVRVVRPALPGEIQDDPPPSIDDYRRAIDAHVEATARSRAYNSAAHLASYAASTVPLWASEAATFIAWRDQVWLTSIGLMQTLQEPLSIAEALELLPQIEWPE
jgi:hypothetical protein